MNPRLGLLKNIARRLLRRGRYYPIAFGPLRGLRLQFNDHVTLGELLGLWERNNFRVISLLSVTGLLESSPNTVLFDIGANFGLYTLFFAKLLPGQGRIFEGAADSALPHCQRIIWSERPFFLIEFHPLKKDAAIGALMENFGYCGSGRQ